jgi:hypothetical protein
MTQNSLSIVLSRAALAASVASVACLALSGCGANDSDDDSADDSTNDAAGAPGAAPPVPVEIRPRAEGSAATASRGDNAAASAGAPPPATDNSDAPPANTADDDAAASATPPDVSASQPAAQAFEACTTNGGSYGDNCDTIYVAMTQASPARCVQLTIDNCGGYSRQGIGAHVPLSWRLSSGSIGSTVSPCELGVFYTDRTGVSDAEGTISWNESTRLPTEIVLELTLQPTSSAVDTTSLDIATPVPLNPVACAD